ncbi:Flagellar hook-length control protein FliK [Minicystis rosea]|nr:Flagellar hook-length control protein FliK [Minicystis rosea]
MRQATLLGVLLCAMIVAHRPLHAREAASVTVVSPPHAGPLVEEAVIRLSAELRAAGFSVRLVEGRPNGDGRAQVEATPGAPRGTGPGESFATVTLVTTHHGAVVDMWVADHVTKKTLVRRIDLGDAGATNAASDLAVRTVELLQVSLMEVSDARKQSLPPDLKAWIKTPKPPPPRAPYASIEAAFGVLVGATFGGSPLPLFRAAVHLPKTFSIRAFVAPAITTTTLTSVYGAVSLRQTVAALDLAYAFGLERARLYPVIALGGGLYDLRFTGQATAPSLGHQGHFLTAALAADAGVGVRILPHLSALLDLEMIVLQTEPAVTIVGHQVGRAGRPTFLPSLGLVASF